MKPTHIEHIGIAVSNLEESIRYYEQVLGLECYAIEEVTDQKVRTAFFQVGETKIELLESTDPSGPVGKFIEKRGEGVMLISFNVDNTRDAIDELEKKDYPFIGGARPFRDCEFAFIHPKKMNGVLLELIDYKWNELEGK